MINKSALNLNFTFEKPYKTSLFLALASESLNFINKSNIYLRKYTFTD